MEGGGGVEVGDLLLLPDADWKPKCWVLVRKGILHKTYQNKLEVIALMSIQCKNTKVIVWTTEVEGGTATIQTMSRKEVRLQRQRDTHSQTCGWLTESFQKRTVPLNGRKVCESGARHDQDSVFQTEKWVQGRTFEPSPAWATVFNSTGDNGEKIKEGRGMKVGGSRRWTCLCVSEAYWDMMWQTSQEVNVDKFCHQAF